MVAVESVLSLSAERRNQRRLSALLPGDSSPDIQRFPLRRRFVPQDFCYVCSRLDPAGIFKNPNAHLFRKGFFTACEHLPKAPHSTFIGEAIVQEYGDHGDLPVIHSSAPSIAVTIKRGSSLEPISREHTRSSLKPLSRGYAREKTHHSIHEIPERTISGITAIERANKEYYCPANVDDVENEYSKSNGKDTPTSKFAIVPPLTIKSPDEANSDVDEESFIISPDNNTVGMVNDEIDDELYVSKKHLVKKDSGVSTIRRLTPINLMHATIGADTENELTGGDTIKSPMPQAEKPTEKNINSHRSSALSLSIKSDRHSAVSGLSIFSKGSSAWAMQGKESGMRRRGSRTERRRVDGQTTAIINQEDGLGPVHLMEQQDKQFKGFNEKLFYKRRRPKAGRSRRRTDPSEMSTEDERLDSGYFLYHHRNDEDSVPDPGFIIPATPTPEERLEMERLEQERIEQQAIEEERLAEERRAIEEQIAAGNVFVEGSAKSDSAEDDDVIELPEGQSHTASVLGQSLSGKLSFCKCSSDLLNADSTTVDVCKFCGKYVRRQTKRTGEPSNLTISRKATSLDSRRRILYGREKSSSLSKQLLSKTDEDYMDLEGIIQGENTHYWSDNDTNRSQTCTRSSIRRRVDARPYALVDPNIHKFVYIQALQDARIKQDIKYGSKKNRLTKPHVFSYFELWPFAGRRAQKLNEPLDIGLRQADTANIKPGQYMKHIFGDVKPDDYYPGGAKNFSKRIDIGVKKPPAGKWKGEKTASRQPTDVKEPSVARMRLRNSRQGVSFGEDD